MSKLRDFCDALKDFEVASIIKELKSREDSGILINGVLREKSREVHDLVQISINDGQKCLESYVLMRGALAWAETIKEPSTLVDIPHGCKATFQRQQWINDYATDSASSEEVDVTRKILMMTVEEIQNLSTDTWASDALVDTQALGHDGPFYVTCDFALQEFFGVDDISDVTQEILDQKREEFKEYL